MKYFKPKGAFTPAVNEYLLSIPPSEYLKDDPSSDFRGRSRIYYLIELIQKVKHARTEETNG